MDIGLFAPVANPFATADYLTAFGREAEDRGIESIWIGEHVVLFDDYESPYPYATDGRIPAPPDMGMLEPFAALSFLAACTERIRLGTGICLVPQRNPVYTAKQVADLDWLSAGRAEFGVGVGWLREEFEVLNVPWEHRGARTDEYLEVLKTLWTDEKPSFSGEFWDLPECRMYPKPVQDPHPRIHVGGESDAALRRAARFGQGWFGFNLLPEQAPERVAMLTKLLEAEGRAREDVQISICSYFHGLTPDMVEQYREAGIDRVIALFIAMETDQIPGALDDLVPSVEAAKA